MSLFDIFRTPKSVRVPPPHIQERENSRWNSGGQLIVIRCGNKEELYHDTLKVAELGYCADIDEYFIGTENGYMLFDDFKLLASNLYIERGASNFIGLDKLGYEKFLNGVEEGVSIDNMVHTEKATNYSLAIKLKDDLDYLVARYPTHDGYKFKIDNGGLFDESRKEYVYDMLELLSDTIENNGYLIRDEVYCTLSGINAEDVKHVFVMRIETESRTVNFIDDYIYNFEG